MDELEISGKRYISSRRAGKDHGYHADYIGQLIRAKKVTGQKVGRAWYVDAESLATYLGTEAAPREASAPVARMMEPAVEISEEITEPEVVEVVEEIIAEPDSVSVIEVAEVKDIEEAHIPIKISEPVDLKKEEQPIFYRSVKEEREARTKTGLRYIADEGPLLPPIKKSAIHIRQEIVTPIPLKIVERPIQREVHIQKVEEDTPVVKVSASAVKRVGPAKKNILSLLVMRAGVVLALGAVVFAIAAFASSHLLFTETLVGGQSANAGYSVK